MHILYQFITTGKGGSPRYANVSQGEEKKRIRIITWIGFEAFHCFNLLLPYSIQLQHFEDCGTVGCDLHIEDVLLSEVCIFSLLTCQAIVTVGDSGLCCCCLHAKSFERWLTGLSLLIGLYRHYHYPPFLLLLPREQNHAGSNCLLNKVTWLAFKAGHSWSVD